jgi:hypothetical protein
MVTRRGWERGPVPCRDQNERAARPTSWRPSRSSNRHQPKLPPPIVTLSRSEGSVVLGVEMLRGVYPERSECAQHDRAVLLPRHRPHNPRHPPFRPPRGVVALQRSLPYTPITSRCAIAQENRHQNLRKDRHH